jgi:lipopolysaccharide transport system ATP-binding protein
MEKEVLIKAEGVSKKFCKSLKKSLVYGGGDIIKGFLGVEKKQELRPGEFWAVSDVNFEVRRGECLGLIGHNGAGKSTLLKMLNGLIRPDNGRIEMHGKVGALIELGAGFSPLLTGRENVYNNGAVLGFSKEEIDKKFDDIVEFAELADFIDSPVQNYSSGMKVRLGFAIAAQMDPDILLVDEVLAVGDVNFQLKCFNKIGELRKNGTAIILVSHNSHQILTFSNQGLVLEKGKQICLDNVESAFEIYNKNIKGFDTQGEIEKVLNGTEYFKIRDVFFEPQIVDNKIQMINDQLKVKVLFESTRSLQDCEVDIVLRAPFQTGIDFFQANNKAYNYNLSILEGEGEFEFTINDLNFNGLTLRLFFAIWLKNRTECIFWWRNIPVKFSNKSFSSGIFGFPMNFTLNQ